jgi:hypothetical protein
MTVSENNIPSLASLEYLPYLDNTGELSEQLQGKIGVYAIFDQEKVLQFVGYSRNVYLSCKQHLVRVPDKCYWLKVQSIERPHRSLLENIAQAWINENDSLPLGNGEEQEKWTNPINAKELMTTEEKANYQNPLLDDLARMKLLKNVARRVENEILTVLESRGIKSQIRFNPKLKESGVLDLK